MTTRKNHGHPLFPLALVFMYLCLLGVVIFLIDYLSKEEIADILKTWVPWNFRVNLLFLTGAVVICFGEIRDAVRRFLNRQGAVLGCIFLAALFIAAFVAPRTHRIFYDEDIYANVGQTMALADKAGYCNYGTFEYGEYDPHWISYNKEPSGWPFLISLAFQLFGTDEQYAFLMNNFLFGCGVLVVFFITLRLTGAYFPSLLAGLVFCLIPHNITWSNTAAAEPSAGLFAGLTVLSVLVFAERKDNRSLFLMALLIPLACQMRPESVMIIGWSAAALLILCPRVLLDRRPWRLGLLTACFLLPLLLHFYVVSGHSWGAEGDTFSLVFFWNNLYTNGIYYLDNRQFPVVITALGAFGLVFSRNPLRWRLLIFLWFLLFWSIFLFFYAGNYYYGADVRFSLVSFMPLCVLAGMGGGWVRDKALDAKERWGLDMSRLVVSTLLPLVLVFSFIWFLPLVRRVGQEAWGARYDHRYAKKFVQKIPERSIILTQNPTMFLLWNHNAIQAYAGINNPGLIKDLMKKYQGHVYFHYNYWCNTQSDRNRRLCREIMERYGLQEIVRANEQDYEYALYQMSLKE